MIHLELTEAEARVLLVNSEFVERVFAATNHIEREREMFSEGSPRQMAIAKLTGALERAGVEWDSIRSGVRT